MGQVVFELPKRRRPAGPVADRFITEGFQAEQECLGRGENPYDSGSRRFDWWDEGWCEAALCDLPPGRREELEIWLAGGNE